jgi:hypothetical protein
VDRHEQFDPEEAAAQRQIEAGSQRIMDVDDFNPVFFEEPEELEESNGK